MDIQESATTWRRGIDEVKKIILQGPEAIKEWSYRTSLGKPQTASMIFYAALAELMEENKLPFQLYRPANVGKSMTLTDYVKTVQNLAASQFPAIAENADKQLKDAVETVRLRTLMLTPDECAAPETIQVIQTERMKKLRKNIPSMRRQHW